MVDDNHWPRVRGPNSVVVATHIYFDWVPRAPDYFVADNKQEFEIPANGDATYFKQMLLESAQRQAWRLASLHSGRTDFIGGADLTSAISLLRNYANRGMWAERGMAIATASNGIHLLLLSSSCSFLTTC